MNLGILGMYSAAFFFGEYATIPFFTLAHQGKLNLTTIALITYTASLSADLFWFGASKIFFKKLYIQNWYKKAQLSNQKVYNYIFEQHILFALTFIKFLIGLRLILTLSLIFVKKFTFKQYLGFALISNFFLIIGLDIIGYCVSKGLNLLPIYKGISGIITIVIITVLITHLFPYIFKFYISK